MSCETRWWKSRFQRKRRGKKLIQSCGRQLMHWQVKVSCSSNRCHHHKGEKRRCRHYNNNGLQSSISCQQWLRQPPVIRETVADRSEPRAAARNDADGKNVKDAFADPKRRHRLLLPRDLIMKRRMADGPTGRRKTATMTTITMTLQNGSLNARMTCSISCIKLTECIVAWMSGTSITSNHWTTCSRYHRDSKHHRVIRQ